jgi:hypothetical protein
VRAIDACRISSTVVADALVDHPPRRRVLVAENPSVSRAFTSYKHRVALLGVPKTGDPREQRDREVAVADIHALDIRSSAAPNSQREPSERLAGAMIDAKHAESSPNAIVV